MPSQQNYRVINFESVPSTNNKLKELKNTTELQEYTVVYTDNQTSGKGQAGNSWESEAGKNLTFSVLLKPTYIEIQNQFIISKAITLGILDVLKSYSDGLSIKWPNDIYYKNKKIGGILIENSIYQNIISESIVGIGININQSTFISDAPNPISLKTITNKHFELSEMLDLILNSCLDYIEEIRQGKFNLINKPYFENLYRKEGFHKYKDKNSEFKASIKGINCFGHLELITINGDNRSYAFKEVEFII